MAQIIATAFAYCASMAPAWKQRADLRSQLFSGEAKNTPGKQLDEDDWLVPNWSVYIKLNFELRDPGYDKAVAELRKMVADSHCRATLRLAGAALWERFRVE